MYEHRGAPLLPRRQFFNRLATHALAAVVIGFGALWLGMAGYHWLEGFSWLDAYLNAAMILGGMGPVAELHTSAGKLFAGTYALFAGVVFLVVAGVVFAPVVHRTLHRFHLADAENA
jgi:hypothetical protein